MERAKAEMPATAGPVIIEKRRRTTGEMVAALELDALNPLSKDAAEEIKRISTINHQLLQEHLMMKRAFWCVLASLGGYTLSEYRMKHAPENPLFAVKGNRWNKDKTFFAVGESGEPIGALHEDEEPASEA